MKMQSNLRHNFYYYLDDDTINETAINLIFFGGEIFKRAQIIERLLPLKDAVTKRNNNQISKSEFIKIAEPYFIENQIDAIRICIFFENYMKSTLISKGYLIHKIKSDERYKAFLKLQNIQPIPVKDFHGFENFIGSKKENYVYNEGLLPETISLGTMIHKKKYVDVINLPEGILRTIIEINNQRNQLHFINEWAFSISEPFLNKIEALNSFVDDLAKKMIRK